MKTKLVVLCVLMVFFVATGCNNASLQEPNQCKMCTMTPHHALCIMNLSTGEVLELRVYDSHPFLANELAEEQREGYFSLLRYAGVGGYMEGAKLAKAFVPVDAASMDSGLFCKDCNETLRACRDCGFVLIDAFDVSDIKFYPIEDGTAFTVRCYEVAISVAEDTGKYEVNVIGTLQLK